MKILKKKDLFRLLEKAGRNYKLISPAKKPWGDTLFEETGPVSSLPQGYALPYNSLKDFFFPQSEVLLPPGKTREDKRVLFFGVRPCDTKALNFHDSFFSRKPEDIYYLHKRQSSLIISVSCDTPVKGCFCLFSRSGPYLQAKDNFDLQFSDLGDEYAVEAGNKKGESFILSYREFFSRCNHSQEDKKDHCHQRCGMKMEQAYEMEKINKKLGEENMDGLWKELGMRCTNCGGCEFICPTCFCFNLQDYAFDTFGDKPRCKPIGAYECVDKRRVVRMRSWDSCAYEGYSRMAGGFNPYYRREARVRRRFYCKLYHAQVWFNTYGCVGCGRCTAACPVNLDMESFIASLMKKDKYKPLLTGL